MVTQNSGASFQIAFYAFRPTENDLGFVGAVLVTDDRGIPLEFRCTHPVKPTAVQKALYGSNLESHVSVDLCGKPLLEAVRTNPIACVVENRELVSLREVVDLPVLYLQKSGEVLEETGQPHIVGHTRSFTSSSKVAANLSVRCHSKWESDFEKTREVLEQASSHIDLLEPFDRITTSLSILATRDERFS